MTNPLLELERVARAAVPQMTAVHEPPFFPTGFHDLILRWDGRYVHVRWRGDIGFRIAEVRDDDDDAGFDSVASVFATSLDDAIKCLLHVLGTQHASASAR